MWTNLPAMIPWCSDPYLGTISTNNIMHMCTKSSNKMQICLILTADNMFRSKFDICKFQAPSCDTIRRDFQCIINGKIYTSMFWFEIFVLKLSLVYDLNLCNVIFWMFLWDLFQWFVIIFHSIDSQVKSTDYSCERLLRKKMENMSPFKYILSNQLVMKIYL